MNSVSTIKREAPNLLRFPIGLVLRKHRGISRSNRSRRSLGALPDRYALDDVPTESLATSLEHGDLQRVAVGALSAASELVAHSPGDSGRTSNRRTHTSRLEGELRFEPQAELFCRARV